MCLRLVKGRACDQAVRKVLRILVGGESRVYVLYIA